MVSKRSSVESNSEDRVLLLPQKQFGEMFGSESEKKILKFSQRAAYSFGHVMNDICSAMWFSYTLLFFELVLQMPSGLAGILICVGQVADALASPMIGIFVDRYGTRKSWHMLGTALIAFTFSLIFSKCPWNPDIIQYSGNGTQSDYNEWDNGKPGEVALKVLYYSCLVIIFQAGWATVQIAHLAIIPDLSPNKSDRADLTAIRYTATVCSSVFVYLVTWLILHVTDGNKGMLGPADSYKFKDVVLIGLLVGGTFTMLFHGILDTPITSSHEKNPSAIGLGSWATVIKEYFKSWPLYQVTLLYFSSRMLLNISLVYMPLYLVEIVHEKTEYIATVPLVSFTASFLASLAVRQARYFCDGKTSYLIGGIISIGACLWIGVGLKHSEEVFGISALLGAGSSITGVASLCLCADLIGADTKNGAFVYSVVTAVDKLLGGVVVIIIEFCKDNVFGESPHYYQEVLAYGCGVSTILGLLSLFTVHFNLKPKQKLNRSSSEPA